MLKEYIWRGTTWQFEETEAPKDAVLVKKPAAKKAAPRNKARKTETKEA